MSWTLKQPSYLSDVDCVTGHCPFCDEKYLPSNWTPQGKGDLRKIWNELADYYLQHEKQCSQIREWQRCKE